MTDKPTGGLAFPQSIAVGPAGDVYGTDDIEGANGMTLRDYAAIQFITGLLASDHRGSGHVELGLEIADRFIAERDK